MENPLVEIVFFLTDFYCNMCPCAMLAFVTHSFFKLHGDISGSILTCDFCDCCVFYQIFFGGRGAEKRKKKEKKGVGGWGGGVHVK